MVKETNNLLIAASGTGGHIFPALAIAEDLNCNWQIYWLGIKNRCEINLVPKKYNLLTMDFSSPRSRNIFLLIQYLKIIFSTFEVIKIIRKKQISLVFTTGGYISAPTIIAAKILNVPIILHESNIVPGSVTKFFGRLCDFVLTGFKDANLYLQNCKIVFTGTPIRKQFYFAQRLPSWVPNGNGPLILVMGGSQGARGLNKMFYGSLDFLLENNFRIIHLVGDSELGKCNNARSKNYVRKKFTDEVASIMQNCDLVISRAGSGAINELMQTRKPSILIPYPNSKNNHQDKNALYLCSMGGAILLNEDLCSSYNLTNTLKRIFNYHLREDHNNTDILKLMKKNMSELNLIDAREEIIKIVNQFKNEF